MLLNGLSQSSSSWPGDLLYKLATNRQVITFDYRGMGSEDSVPSDQLTIEDVAKSSLDFFQALGLVKPDILGWSWGGATTLWIGAFHGDKVNKLVSFSGYPDGNGAKLGQYLLNFPDPRNLGQKLPAPVVFPDSHSGNAGLCKYSAFQSFMPGKAISQDQIRNQSIVKNKFSMGKILSSSLSKIKNPTLLFHGVLDVLYDYQTALYLSHNIPGSILHTGRNAGHAYIHQDAESILPLVLSFLGG